MEESQVTAVEQNRDDMKTFSQEAPFRNHEQNIVENGRVNQMNLS